MPKERPIPSRDGLLYDEVMSATTRLVVLGAVHQFQPVHGYLLRRELIAWHVGDWANVQAGSVYNALRSLENDGLLVENGTETAGNRPERTTYSLTTAGNDELLRMLRDALRNVDAFDTKPAMVLSTFMFVLPREEVLAGLQHRITEADARIASNTYRIGDIPNPEASPRQPREIFELATTRLRGEQQWMRELSERIRAGDYTFAGEEAGDGDAAIGRDTNRAD